MKEAGGDKVQGVVRRSHGKRSSAYYTRGRNREEATQEKISYKKVIAHQFIVGGGILFFTVLATFIQFSFAEELEFQVYRSIYKNYSISQIYEFTVKGSRTYYPIFKEKLSETFNGELYEE